MSAGAWCIPSRASRVNFALRWGCEAKFEMNVTGLDKQFEEAAIEGIIAGARTEIMFECQRGQREL